MIPYSRQKIDNQDISSVKKVLKSNYLTTGPETLNFENNVRKFLKCKYAISTSSASAALHVSLIAIGFKKNDILWTTPITFTSTASAALHLGGKVDFVDIDENTFNISVSKLEKKLLQAKKKNKLPKLVIPVHLGGNPCDMKKIKHLSKKYGFKIIEDASHAFGSKIRNKQIGNCQYSDITVFSFHPVKIITTCEGGIATTKNKKLYETMRVLREHGIERNSQNLVNKKEGAWYYEHQLLGFNYRLSDVHASLGNSQLKKVKKFVKVRNKIANIYIKNFNKLKIQYQIIEKKNYCSYHLFIILVPKMIHKKIFNFLRSKKFFVNIHYIPLFMHPIYNIKKSKYKKFQNSLNYYRSAISLPIYDGLKIDQQKKIINIISKFIKS